MSDCPPTIYHPVEPYVTHADMCNGGGCSGFDFNPTTPADPDADPPVLEVPSSDTILFAQMAMAASRRVFIATGDRFPGCVTTTWRPCREGLCCGRGSWRCSSDACFCDSFPKVELPFGPVRSITSVTIDGEALSSDAYEVDGRWLRRIDGEDWPACDGWEIVYRHGIDIPPEAKPLIAAYARELAKLCLPGAKCALPNGYKVVKTGSIEYQVIDPLDYREKLLTGFIPLDDWIIAIMGKHARTRPRIAGRRRTGRRMPNAEA